MNNSVIRLGAKVRTVTGGRISTVIGHVRGSASWLHLVEFKVGRKTMTTWLGRDVLVEVE